MQIPPPAPPPSLVGRRIPDELVLKVITTCNDLAQERTRTLASLCRLSKRYRPLASALLYSHVYLSAYDGVRTGTALHTLLWSPQLRVSVKSVKLSLDDSAVAKEPAIALLLGDLVNVDSIEAYYVEFALRKLLASPSVRRVDEPGALGPRAPSSRISLAVDDHLEATFFAPLTATFATELVGLRLPLWDNLAHFDLGACFRLEHLAFAVGPMRGAAPYSPVFQAATVALAMAHSLPALKSFAISGTLLVVDPTRMEYIDRFLPMRRHQVPPTARALLYAIPRQIQHLSLVTNAFHPSDVAAYLMSVYRPPRLRTVRVGDEVGRGLAEIMRDEAGVAAALEGAGIEMTTVG
ncbi:hypothetical protein JCM9279_001855 [Rhodotorula babjevae]